MRFTQFGHQVPRRNSTITGPRAVSSPSDTLSPTPRPATAFAVFSVNSGARSPTFTGSSRDSIIGTLTVLISPRVDNGPHPRTHERYLRLKVRRYPTLI